LRVQPSFGQPIHVYKLKWGLAIGQAAGVSVGAVMVDGHRVTLAYANSLYYLAILDLSHESAE